MCLIRSPVALTYRETSDMSKRVERVNVSALFPSDDYLTMKTTPMILRCFKSFIVTGPHSSPVLINKFVLKSHLRRFYKDCGIHDFFLIQDLFLGKNKSYKHSVILIHVFIVVFSSLVQFNKIQYYSDNSVIMSYLFFHFIFLQFTENFKIN